MFGDYQTVVDKQPLADYCHWQIQLQFSAVYPYRTIVTNNVCDGDFVTSNLPQLVEIVDFTKKVGG